MYVFPSLTWGSTGYSNNRTERWDISDDLTLSMGRHTLKAGGAFLRFRSNEESQHNIGTWTFGTDQFFDGSAAAIRNLRNPIQFTASFPPLPRHLRADWIQTYVQDEWRVLSNLTLDVGLRYENLHRAFNNHITFDGRPRLAELINPDSRADNNNWGPRFGLAWDVRGDGRTVVRPRHRQVLQQRLRQHPAQRGEHAAPKPGQHPESVVSGSVWWTVAAELRHGVGDAERQHHGRRDRTARVHSFNVGLSHELRPNLAIHVDGVFSKGAKANQIANINTPDPITGRRPLPTWGNILEYRAAGESDYRALYLRLDKRFSGRTQYLVSYTLAKDEDWGAGGTTVVDFYHPEYD